MEDGLFRFGQNLSGSDELRNALTDESVPVERRQAVVADLLGGKASPVTTPEIPVRKSIRFGTRPS